MRSDYSQLKDFEIIEKLKKYFDKETIVQVIGNFEWVEIERPNGRIKKSYKIAKSKIIGIAKNDSHLAWYINTTNEYIELIVDFSFKRMGETTLYQFILLNNELHKINSKILKIR